MGTESQNAMGTPLEVVAAVIERDGLILIGQRKPGGRHPGKWEFPGGKVERGEETRAALARELREELGIEAVIGPEIERYDFAYSAAAVTRLIFYHVTEFSGELVNLDFAQVAWARRESLPGFEFLAGDVEFVRRLAGK
jgi:8-oxo-dGTP diphosphatase